MLGGAVESPEAGESGNSVVAALSASLGGPRVAIFFTEAAAAAEFASRRTAMSHWMAARAALKAFTS
jgi:hypothetical protein